MSWISENELVDMMIHTSEQKWDCTATATCHRAGRPAIAHQLDSGPRIHASSPIRTPHHDRLAIHRSENCGEKLPSSWSCAFGTQANFATDCSLWPILQMSPGLMRAREPYRAKNAVTGLAIGSFIVGVWLYSMSAVKQDNFDDVDEEARAMVKAGVKPLAEKGAEAMTTVAITKEKEEKKAHRGLLALLDTKLPGLLDPEGRTVVFGAPPVDRIGRIGHGGSSRSSRP
jgi:cytochrome c oxidase assembly factor 3, fungi type